MRRVLAVLALLSLCGCYFDRITNNYDSLYDVNTSDDDSAIVEKSEYDEIAEKRNIARLEELAKEGDPVYRMNAGDKIEIRVYGHEDIGITTKIGPDGCVGIAFVGEVKLSGKTIAEGAEEIRKGIAPYVKNPVVSIAVIEIVSETATIAGACRHPGVFGISNSTRLADLYATAGAGAERLVNGVVIDVADLSHSILVRKGEIIPVDFEKAISKGDFINNVRIRKGDYVYIAQCLDESITICGEVATPQKRLYEHGMGLIETLTAAGWMRDTHWNHVIIIRDGLATPKMYKVDVDGILAGKCRNVTLKAGDIIYVPKDNLSEYNVFVKKLLPTAQLVNLLTSRLSTVNSN